MKIHKKDWLVSHEYTKINAVETKNEADIEKVLKSDLVKSPLLVTVNAGVDASALVNNLILTTLYIAQNPTRIFGKTGTIIP